MVSHIVYTKPAKYNFLEKELIRMNLGMANDQFMEALNAQYMGQLKKKVRKDCKVPQFPDHRSLMSLVGAMKSLGNKRTPIAWVANDNCGCGTSTTSGSGTASPAPPPTASSAMALANVASHQIRWDVIEQCVNSVSARRVGAVRLPAAGGHLRAILQCGCSPLSSSPVQHALLSEK